METKLMSHYGICNDRKFLSYVPRLHEHHWRVLETRDIHGRRQSNIWLAAFLLYPGDKVFAEGSRGQNVTRWSDDKCSHVGDQH